MPTPKKNQVNVRLETPIKGVFEELQDLYGMSQSQLVVFLTRTQGKREGLHVPDVKRARA